MSELDQSPLVIEAISPPGAPFYVYLLVDPTTRKPFYVGKGRGERFASHGIEAASSPRQRCRAPSLPGR